MRVDVDAEPAVRAHRVGLGHDAAIGLGVLARSRWRPCCRGWRSARRDRRTRRSRPRPGTTTSPPPARPSSRCPSANGWPGRLRYIARSTTIGASARDVAGHVGLVEALHLVHVDRRAAARRESVGPGDRRARRQQEVDRGVVGGRLRVLQQVEQVEAEHGRPFGEEPRRRRRRPSRSRRASRRSRRATCPTSSTARRRAKRSLSTVVETSAASRPATAPTSTPSIGRPATRRAAARACRRRDRRSGRPSRPASGSGLASAIVVWKNVPVAPSARKRRTWPFGCVPASSSCALVWPSPSGSAAGSVTPNSVSQRSSIVSLSASRTSGRSRTNTSSTPFVSPVTSVVRCPTPRPASGRRR